MESLISVNLINCICGWFMKLNENYALYSLLVLTLCYSDTLLIVQLQEAFVLAHNSRLQSITRGTAQHQELKTAGHITLKVQSRE